MTAGQAESDGGGGRDEWDLGRWGGRGAGAGIARDRAGPRMELLGHRGFAYTKGVRAAVLQAMEGKALAVADMARLHWRLGGVYADLCADDVRGPGCTTAELVGMHGQTVYHQARGMLALREKACGRPGRWARQPWCESGWACR